MEDISVIGLDIAKNVFHACMMNSAGKVVSSQAIPIIWAVATVLVPPMTDPQKLPLWQKI